MRRTGFLLAVVAVSLMAAGFAAAQEKPWLDLQNCSFCRHLTTDPKLLENMTWDHYDISNGLMSVTTVKPEFKASYLKAEDDMKKLGEEMAKGKTDIKMCGMCDYYVKLMAAGAKFEPIVTPNGSILLITSDKPEVLQMIRTFGQRTRDELAKVSQQEPPKKPAE
jgi:hypothetical protein